MTISVTGRVTVSQRLFDAERENAGGNRNRYCYMLRTRIIIS